MDIFSIEIGRKVKELRKRKRYNQDYFASLIDISRASLTNMENGRQAVSLKKVYQMAIALNIEVSEFLPTKKWFEKNKNKKIRIKKIIEVYED